MTVKTKLHICIQHLAPQHFLSWLAGWLATRRWAWLKNWQLRYFIRRFDVNVAEAENTDPFSYSDFNQFFTRRLQAGARSIATTPDAIVSPADGTVSQLGNISASSLLQAKGKTFSLLQLLGGKTELANAFQAGSFATIYLSPKDYHRVHMPYTGTLKETLFIPGRLFSVNEQSVAGIPNLFARNERLVCVFETDRGPMVVILVGAMLVGSICTSWCKTYKSPTLSQQHFPSAGEASIRIERGAELGYFQMGSTVITLFPAGQMEWQPHLQPRSTVQMGQLLGKTCAS